MTYEEKTGMLLLNNTEEDFRTAIALGIDIDDIDMDDHHTNSVYAVVYWNEKSGWEKTIQIPAPTLHDLLERSKSGPVVFKVHCCGDVEYTVLIPGKKMDDCILKQYMVIGLRDDLLKTFKIETQLAQGVWVPVNTQEVGE